MVFVDPKSDIGFKKIFANENKKEILISFLNAILELKEEKAISEIEILNPYQAPRLRELKETTLDIKAKDKQGITFIIEMQVENQDYYGKRALYYTSKSYVSQIDRGMDYPKLNQVIFIGILDYTLFSNYHYISRHYILNTENYKQEITDFELNFIELPKFNKKEDELETIIDQWIYFIKHAGNLKVIPESLTRVEEIQEAFEIANRHNWSKEEAEVYEYWEIREGGHLDALATARREGLAKGIAEGKAKGIAEGKAEGKAEGITEGIEKGRIESLITILKTRFDNVPEEIIQKIQSIRDIKRLDELLKQAIQIKQLDQL